MSILKEIVEKTIITIDKRKESKSLDHLKSQIENLTLADPNFKKSLLKKDEAIIAEIKKASPSAGIFLIILIRLARRKNTKVLAHLHFPFLQKNPILKEVQSI